MSRATWQSLYLILTGAVFFLVALLHLVRLLNHWPIVVGTWAIPMWLSWVGFPVSSGYCVWACWLLGAGRKTQATVNTSDRRDRAKF